MIIASGAIYFSSANIRQEDFYNRLNNKARSTANLFFNAQDVDVDQLLSIENDNPVFLQNEKILIINYKNDIVYHTDANADIKIRNDVLEKVRLGYKVTYMQDSYKILGILYFNSYNRFVILAAAIDNEGALHLAKLKNILIVVFLVSLILFFVTGWFYSGRALKPISRVVKKVEEISITSLNLRVFEGNGNDEIGRLAKTFNKMLDRLEKSFAMQKDFIANASHELRTPLTSINGQLEVLIMKDRTTEEYKSALESVLDDIKSLIDLSNRLLLIARTSAEGPVNFNNRVRIDEVLWQVHDETIRFHNNYHINISIDDSLTDSDQMIVTGEESLLKVALSNIIDNACKYSHDHTVKINLHYNDHQVELIFIDRGIGISDDDLKKIFEPFYRGSNVQSMSGSGIGLPLVNQIISNHNGKINISSDIGKGTIVTIILPSAT